MSEEIAQRSDQPPAVEPNKEASDRLMSLDALRGFDMLWITGGESLIFAAYAILGYDKAPDWLSEQFDHAKWDGFRFEDLIFPLFLFLAGVSIPFAIGKRIERGESRLGILGKIVRRSLLLVFLGVIYNGLLRFDFSLKFNFAFTEFKEFLRLDLSHVRFASVLARIGLGYGFGAAISLFTKTRGRVIAVIALLVGYWIVMMFVPVPGHGAGDLRQGNNMADYVDQHILPGKFYKGNHDPEGPFSTIPAGATCLLGILAGDWLRRPQPGGHLKALGLLGAGAAALALGALWNLHFPINKNLWTSSFVLWAGGWSLLLLSLFYWLVDVLKLRGWAFVFVVIGMNSITIYLAQDFIDFNSIADVVFGHHAPLHAALMDYGCLALALRWLFLYMLYRNKWFFRA